MNQQTAVYKAYTEMVERDLCYSEKVKPYLSMLFAIGYNQGRYQQSNMRPVIQTSIKGEINEYISIDAAQRATGISKQSICNVLAGDARTAGKCRWRYENYKL